MGKRRKRAKAFKIDRVGTPADRTDEGDLEKQPSRKKTKLGFEETSKCSVLHTQSKDGEVEITTEDGGTPSPLGCVGFPYPTDADDHCETPKEAYGHIAPLLHALKEQSLRIYDPYYCDGAVQTNLAELGFPNVYNMKEDCYQVWERANLPDFHAVITNPPYSGDHIEKLMSFVTSPAYGKRPWFLLLPNWVHKKDFFVNATKNIAPFYIVPRKRYVYIPPVGFREAKKSDVHKKSSPFVSMWYIWGGTNSRNQLLIQSYYDRGGDGPCDLARSKSALRDLRRKKR